MLPETIGACYQALKRRFQAAGLPDAGLDARVLMEKLADVSHTELIAYPERLLDAAKRAALGEAATRREGGEPVFRILGERDFWSLTFQLSPATLEPRPDTETLVEAVLETLRARHGASFVHKDYALADFGTGSGCIAISLLHELPHARMLAVDLNPQALAIAHANAVRHGVAARFLPLCASWLDALSSQTRFDVMVSNPPYIVRAVIDDLAHDVSGFDPLLALDGGTDGLDPYRVLVPAFQQRLRPDGFAAFEIGYDQGEAVQALCRKQGFGTIRCLRDLGDQDRVILAHLSDAEM